MHVYRLTYDVWQSNYLDVDTVDLKFKSKSDQIAIKRSIKILKESLVGGGSVNNAKLQRLDKIQRKGRHTVTTAGKILRIPNLVVYREVITKRLFD